MEPDASFVVSPSSASNDVCSLHSGARGHGLRSACDFCHEKRIKCVLTEGQSRCQQCKRRNTEKCNFSVKLKTGPKPKRSRSKPDTSRDKRRKATPGPHLEIIDPPTVADSFAPTENQSSTRPLLTLVVSTNQQQGTCCLPGSHGNEVGRNPTKLGSVPPCDWDIDWRNGKGPCGVQQSMNPSRLSLFSSPAGRVAVGGKASSSRLCRPNELRNFKWREGDLGSCYGGGGSSGDVGVNGTAARRGDFRSGLDFVRDEDAFEIMQKFGAVVELFDAESASNGGSEKA